MAGRGCHSNMISLAWQLTRDKYLNNTEGEVYLVTYIV